jgi:thiol-disulfide isomerase/thioredoxin
LKLTEIRLVILIAVLFFGCVAASAQSPKATSLKLTDIHGRKFSLADYRGKVLLVNFWATWCIPCRTEIPDLVKLQREYRHQGLRIVGISYPPQTLSEVRRAVRDLRMHYRVAIGTRATKDLFTGSQTLPVTVVIDRKGMIREVIEGIMYPDEFEQKVKPLLLDHPGVAVQTSGNRSQSSSTP